MQQPELSPDRRTKERRQVKQTFANHWRPHGLIEIICPDLKTPEKTDYVDYEHFQAEMGYAFYLLGATVMLDHELEYPEPPDGFNPPYPSRGQPSRHTPWSDNVKGLFYRHGRGDIHDIGKRRFRLQGVTYLFLEEIEHLCELHVEHTGEISKFLEHVADVMRSHVRLEEGIPRFTFWLERRN